MNRPLLLCIFLASSSVQARPRTILFSHDHSFVSSDTTVKNKQPVFYLKYFFLGSGPNMWTPQPLLIISGNKFHFGRKVGWYYKKPNNKIKRISSGRIRQSSVDSIISLILPLKDSTVTRTNPFVMSGGCHQLTISNGTDTTKFDLWNTFDYTALKIVNIINQYLPQDDKIWASEELIIQEKESWEWFYKEIEKKKKDSMQLKPNNQ